MNAAALPASDPAAAEPFERAEQTGRSVSSERSEREGDGGMISWNAARAVAAGISRRHRLIDSDWVGLADDFAELTPLAESLVTELTGLEPAGHAHASVVDRVGWVDANTASFEQLLTPILERLPVSPAAALPGYGAVARVGRAVTGAEMGALLGWMSGRVLGQYDVIFGALDGAGSGDGTAGEETEDEAEPKNEEDRGAESGGDVLFVGPNIVETERRFGFPRRQFRLWIALHELTHRAQFTGVPWMRPHFLSLVQEAINTSLPEPGQIAEALKRLVVAARRRDNPLDSDAGIFGLFMGEEQRETFGRIQGLMSLLEGHGDIVMDRAGKDRIPLAGHFSRVLAARRNRASRPARLVLQLIGMDAKLRQYAQGEKFITRVEEIGGRELFDRVWEGPANVPVGEEVREPEKWVARIRG